MGKTSFQMFSSHSEWCHCQHLKRKKSRGYGAVWYCLELKMKLSQEMGFVSQGFRFWVVTHRNPYFGRSESLSYFRDESQILETPCIRFGNEWWRCIASVSDRKVYYYSWFWSQGHLNLFGNIPLHFREYSIFSFTMSSLLDFINTSLDVDAKLSREGL